MLKDFIWFWKESSKFTGYKGIKLFINGLMPCVKFMILQKQSRCE